MPADLIRALRPEEITCPAGSLRGDCSVYCSIEDFTTDGRTSPEAVEAYCAGDHKMCPSWQLEKERVEDNKGAHTYLAEKRGEKIVAQARREAHRMDRYARARELLLGDSEEAHRFRARIGVTKKVGARGLEEVAERRAA